MSISVAGGSIAFAPDDSVHVHEEGAIRLICAQFRSHEDGLPEWIKNASDMYRRTDAPPEDSIILVLLQDGRRGALPLVGCLDFGGMTTADIEQKFRQWADPEAAGTGEAAVEGGHGNGGKCYMTQMFESYAYLHTVRDGRGNRYGFRGGSAVPGYFPSRAEGRGYRVENADHELNLALQPFGLTIQDLPEDASRVWSRRHGFTLTLGVGAKSLSRGRIPATKWVENLQGHQQMVRSVQRNRIYVVHNGRLDAASPLKLPQIDPIPGAEAPRAYPVPDEIVDPDSGDAVLTGAIEGVSVFELRTSNVSMRWSLKARHTINGWTHDGRSTGYWEIPSLSRSGYANQIYGDVRLNALAEFKQNDRRNHTDAPLTRALREWIRERIEEYAAEFARLDQLQASEAERTELSRLNEALNAWKNRFLEKAFGGIGTGAQDGMDDSRPPLPRLPRGEPARLVLVLSHTEAGQGVTFRPSLEFFDASGNRIRAVPYQWESGDWAVATVDPDLNVITTYSPGTATISAVCGDSGIRSNAVTLEVVDISEIDLEPKEIEVRAGSRQPVTATVHTKDGRRLQGVYLIWTEDNREVVSVGSGGMVFGLAPGATTVVAGDNQVTAATPTQVTVTRADETDDEGGSGFPRILVSEIDLDPLGEEPPVFSQAEPPVHQRPQDVDHNIWWINMASPLARRYFAQGARSKEWRVYHLERYIEIMVKIVLHYDFMHGEDVSFETLIRRWEEESINMQKNAAETLAVFLGGGEIGPARAAA